MTSAIRLTFLTLGILMFKEIFSASLTKPQATPPPKSPELHGLPDLPGRPDLPSLPALPERPDLPWLPPLPKNMSMPLIPENPNLSSLPSLPTTLGLSTLSKYSTLPTWPSQSTLPTRTLSPHTKFETTKPSIIVTTSGSSNTRPKSSTNKYKKTLTPTKTKRCCSEKTHKTTRYSKKPQRTTNIYDKTEKTASAVTNQTFSTVMAGISTSDLDTFTTETLTTVIPESSSTIFPETKPLEIFTTSSPTTIISESSTVSMSETSEIAETTETSITPFLETKVPGNPSTSFSAADASETSTQSTEASETSTASFTTAEASETSITSSTDTDALENSLSTLSTIDSFETEKTSFSSTNEPETSTSSLLLSTKEPKALTTLLPATESSETLKTSFPAMDMSDTSTRVTVAPEDDTAGVVDTTKLDAHEISSTILATTEAPATSTMSLPGTESFESSTRITETQQDDGTVSVVDPSKLCPNNQSLLSERDLEIIVKYKIENLSLAVLLNESFYAETVSITDSIKDELEQFLIWFGERPEHLKHILEHLTKIRSKLEKTVNKQSDKIQEYTVLQNEYNAKYERLQKLKKKVENYKHICKLNCEEDSLSFASSSHSLSSNSRRQLSTNSSSSLWPWKIIDEPQEQPSSDPYNTHSDILVSVIFDRPEEGGLKQIPTKYTGGGKYYCSNIDALVQRIKNVLLHNLDISKKYFKRKIVEDTKVLKEKVEDLKRNLKSIALKQFGSSMYDILNLQDQYYHFDELLKNDVHNYIIQTKKQFAVFESLIMDLEVRAEKLKKYCSTCNMALRRLGSSGNKDHVKETDLVDYVIDKVYSNVSGEALNNYNKIFNELEPIFKEWESSDEKVANLKPIQEEIAKMTAEETEALNKLKEAFPKSSIANAVELHKKAIELNENANLIEIELVEKYNV